MINSVNLGSSINSTSQKSVDTLDFVFREEIISWIILIHMTQYIF